MESHKVVPTDQVPGTTPDEPLPREQAPAEEFPVLTLLGDSDTIGVCDVNGVCD